MTEAYVTLVATDAYASGALVLSHKLRSLGSEKEIVCLVTPNVTHRIKDLLSKVCVVIPVDTIRSTDFDNLELLGRPELDITFTKIHLWRLTQYSKVVFLDADTFPLKNIDELFDWPSFSAAPDAGWPDCFNSGVFVTEPSETVFNELTALASEKGSFDGGDQGLLNSYFSSWSSNPSQRLPFTFNTTPTAQYGYAPAHNQFGHNISILHFIGQNKPWKYQRFTDGKILPLGGNAWDGLKDMVQEWWNTWDEHYGRTPPYHLLSGEFDHQLHLDSGFQTRPIVPFDELVKNAWDDQTIDFHDERRNIQPMPPISTISIKHPEWVNEYYVKEEQHEPHYQTQPTSHPAEQNHHHHHHHHENQEHHNQEHHNQEHHNQNQHHEHHNEEHHNEEYHHNNEYEAQHDNHHENQNHEEQPHYHEHHEEHQQDQPVEHNHHEEHHQHQHHEKNEKNDCSNENQQQHSSGENNTQGNEQPPHKEETTYSMIEWNPSYQDPPKTGKLGADIPDLSYFKNVWDEPYVQQHRRIWVAPVHQPEPEIMKKPEYSNYNTDEYDSEILYPREIQKVEEKPHVEETQQVENHFEEQETHHEEPQHHEEYHYHQEEYHQEESHHEEPIYPPAFPWDNTPNHFPPPTRVWLNDQPHQQREETPSCDLFQEQEQKPQVHEKSQIEKPRVQEPHVPEQNYIHEEQQKPVEESHHHDLEREVNTHKRPDLHIVIDHHDEKDIQTETAVASTTEVELETEQLPEPLEKEQNNWEQAVFAIDQDLTPSAQMKIDEFIASLAADDNDGSDYSDRDLIPINFKSSSRLQSGMCTPSPGGSRSTSRRASRSNSLNNSRRASIVSSRRNSISAIKKPVTIVDVNSNAPIESTVEQSSKLFAAESSTYSRKTPYTSAAVTPAAIATPEELDRDTYFTEEPVDAGHETEGEDVLKSDFLERTQYSLSDSLDLEGETETDDWDPMKALNKLREHSESMVLRQSLQEALIKTAREQEKEGEFLELASEPVITQPKRPIAFKSSWDDEEYELPSGVISEQSSPRTPVARTLSSNLTDEIEMVKERHKQQRASLMLSQPQTAVASVLEAELDLSEGTLFKRRRYESSETGTSSISFPSETVETFADEEVSVQDKTVFYDDFVVKEAQRKLMALINGEDDKEEPELTQTDSIPLPISKEVKQTLPGTVQVSTESTASSKPTSFADFMLNRKNIASNFGFDESFKSPICQSNFVAVDSVENIKPFDTEIVLEKDAECKPEQLVEKVLEKKESTILLSVEKKIASSTITAVEEPTLVVTTEAVNPTVSNAEVTIKDLELLPIESSNTASLVIEDNTGKDKQVSESNTDVLNLPVTDVSTKTPIIDELSDSRLKEADTCKETGKDLITDKVNIAVEENLVTGDDVSISQVVPTDETTSVQDSPKVEESPTVENTNIAVPIEDNSTLQQSSKHDLNTSEDPAVHTIIESLTNKPLDSTANIVESKISAPVSTEGLDFVTTRKDASEKQQKKASGKTTSGSRVAKNSNEVTDIQKKQTRVEGEIKGKHGINKESKTQEVAKTETNVPVTKVNTTKNVTKQSPAAKTISKRSSDPVLKPLPSKPISVNVKIDKTTKASDLVSKSATGSRNTSSQKPNLAATSTPKNTGTKVLRNKTSAPVLKLSEDSLASSTNKNTERRTSKPGTPTRARSATPPSPPPKTTVQGKAASSSRQATVAKLPSITKKPASPVKTSSPTARQPSPVKATFAAVKPPSPVKPTFPTTRQPSPIRDTFASKAAAAVKSAIATKPLTPSRKELPPRALTGPSKVAAKKTSPVVPVGLNIKSSIATPVTSATSVVSDELVVGKSLPDVPLILSDKSTFSKRKNSKKGKEKASPIASVISTAKTSKPKPDTITSSNAHIVDHQNSSNNHGIEAKSKQLPTTSAHKNTYASVTKSNVSAGEHHHTTSSNDHHYKHHHHTTVKDHSSEQVAHKSHSSADIIESVLNRQSSTSSTSTSAKSLSFTRRGSSSSSISITATDVTTAIGTVSPTASTSSSRKSAKERISSFVKGSAFKKNKKIPKEK